MGEMIINEIDTVTGLALTSIVYSIHHHMHDAYTIHTPNEICMRIMVNGEWWMAYELQFYAKWRSKYANYFNNIVFCLFYYVDEVRISFGFPIPIIQFLNFPSSAPGFE